MGRTALSLTSRHIWSRPDIWLIGAGAPHLRVLRCLRESPGPWVLGVGLQLRMGGTPSLPISKITRLQATWQVAHTQVDGSRQTRTGVRPGFQAKPCRAPWVTLQPPLVSRLAGSVWRGAELQAGSDCTSFARGADTRARGGSQRPPAGETRCVPIAGRRALPTQLRDFQAPAEAEPESYLLERGCGHFAFGLPVVCIVRDTSSPTLQA